MKIDNTHLMAGDNRAWCGAIIYPREKEPLPHRETDGTGKFAEQDGDCPRCWQALRRYRQKSAHRARNARIEIRHATIEEAAAAANAAAIIDTIKGEPK